MLAVCRALAALFVVTVMHLAAGPALAEEDQCLPNRVTGVGSGQLTISEVAVVPRRSYCPVPSTWLGDTFAFRPGRKIHVWYRLEGGEDYLATSQARQRFSVQLERRDPYHTTKENLDIANDLLDVSGALAEAQSEGNDGRFDYRFLASFRYILHPGQYTVTLYQGGRKICLADGGCSLILNIVDER